MFSKLQNRINLKKVNSETIQIDKDFIFKEDFDLVSQTISYFEENKDEVVNIIIEEEIIEDESSELMDFINDKLGDQQEFTYNDTNAMEIAGVVHGDDEESLEELNESMRYHLRETRHLKALLEEANQDSINSFKEVMGFEDEDTIEAEDLFDKNILDLAKSEFLEGVYTNNWLEKEINTFRDEFNKEIRVSSFAVTNDLKKLDINNIEEIKNKISDLQESLMFINENINEVK